MRRAQQIGINVVIIAAIALLVLVIIAIITTEGGRTLNQGAQGCNAHGGRCVVSPAELPGDPADWVQRNHPCGDSGDVQTEVCYVYRFE